MVAGVFLVERTIHDPDHDINRVRQVVVHEDDAQTDAQIIAAVIATLNTNTVRGDAISSLDAYPAGYFNIVTQIGAVPAGPIAVDGELIAFQQEVIRVT
jgi:hypothetical protein